MIILKYYIFFIYFLSEVAKISAIIGIKFTEHGSEEYDDCEDYLYLWKGQESVDSEQFTLCTWINPTRIFQRSKIVSFLNEKQQIVFSFGLNDKRIFAWKEDCHVEASKNIQMREWAFLCISSNITSINIFMNNDYYSTTCRENKTKNIAYVAAVYNNDLSSFVGTIADLNIFLNQTSYKEMTEIYNLSYPSSVNPLRFDTHSEYESSCSTFIIDVSTNMLQNQDSSEIALPIYEKEFFYEADDICSRFGGRLPSDSSEDISLISILINDFEHYDYLNDKFWIKSSEDLNNTCLLGIYKFDKIEIVTVECISFYTQFFCLVKNEKPFRLSKIPNLFDSLSLYPLSDDFHTYSSDTKYIAYVDTYDDKPAFILEDKFIGIVAYRPIEKSSMIVGRHIWNTIFNDEEILVTFSSCKESEFTCSNGRCIDMTLLCNSIEDCTDGIDEQNCNTSIDPPFNTFSKIIFSAENVRNLISFNMELDRIINIDMNKQVIVLSIRLIIIWSDSQIRLRNLPVGKIANINAKTGQKFWLPNIIIPEASVSDQYKLSPLRNYGYTVALTKKNGTYALHNSYEVMMFPGDQVTLMHHISEEISVYCKYYVFDYPFDRQTCKFHLHLVPNDNVKWDKENSILNKSERMSLLLFSDPELKLTFENDDRAIAVKLLFTRKYGGFVFTTLLPCIVLEIIGFLTHFLPCDDYQDRVSVTLACLIVMAALLTQLSNVLPDFSEPKLIDIWMAAHVGLLFLIFINHIIVIYLNQKYRYDYGRRNMEIHDNETNPGWTNNMTNKKKPQKEIEEVKPTRTDIVVNYIGLAIGFIIYVAFLSYFTYINVFRRYFLTE